MLKIIHVNNFCVDKFFAGGERDGGREGGRREGGGREERGMEEGREGHGMLMFVD